MKPIIHLEKITKTYRLGEVDIRVLRGITLSLIKGEHLSIMGPSGSGKTTLMNILGCLDRPSEGLFFLEGQDISGFDDDCLSEVRRDKIGFIFQAYNLVPQLSVVENIGLPLFYRGVDEHIIRERAMVIAERVGLGDRIAHRPSELSGGEQQRVAVARALIGDPALILADEPTGNLDSATGKEIMDLLVGLNREGRTLVVVTHDAAVAGFGRRTIHLKDGEISHEN